MIHTLNHGGWTAQCDSFGGELIALKNAAGKDYLWSGDAKSWAGRSPLLFPNIGFMAQPIVVGGQSYPIHKHGLVRQKEWTLIDEKEASLTYETNSDQATRALYPYEYHLMVTQTLLENGFKTTYTVENTGTEDLPFTIGGHAGFRLALDRLNRFELRFQKTSQLIRLKKQEDMIYKRSEHETVGEQMNHLSLSLSCFEKDAMVLDAVPFHSVDLIDSEDETGFRFHFDDFPVLALWMPYRTPGDFICLEPWHGLPGCEEDGSDFMSKAYAIKLAPGQTRTFTYWMEEIK